MLLALVLVQAPIAWWFSVRFMLPRVMAPERFADPALRADQQRRASVFLWLVSLGSGLLVGLGASDVPLGLAVGSLVWLPMIVVISRKPILDVESE